MFQIPQSTNLLHYKAESSQFRYRDNTNTLRMLFIQIPWLPEGSWAPERWWTRLKLDVLQVLAVPWVGGHKKWHSRWHVNERVCALQHRVPTLYIEVLVAHSNQMLISCMCRAGSSMKDGMCSKWSLKLLMSDHSKLLVWDLNMNPELSWFANQSWTNLSKLRLKQQCLNGIMVYVVSTWVCRTNLHNQSRLQNIWCWMMDIQIMWSLKYKFKWWAFNRW